MSYITIYTYNTLPRHPEWNHTEHRILVDRELTDEDVESIVYIPHRIDFDFDTPLHRLWSHISDEGTPVKIELENSTLEGLFSQFVDILLDKKWRG